MRLATAYLLPRTKENHLDDWVFSGHFPTNWTGMRDQAGCVFLDTRPLSRSGRPWEITFDGGSGPKSVSPLDFPSGCCFTWSRVSPMNVLLWTDHDSAANVWIWKQTNSWLRREPGRLRLDPLQAFSDILTSESESRFFVMSPGRYTFELLRFDASSGKFAPYVRTLRGLYLNFSKDGKDLSYVSADDRSLWVSRSDKPGKAINVRETTGRAAAVVPRWHPPRVHGSVPRPTMAGICD